MLSTSRITKPAVAANIIDRQRLYQRLDCWQEVRAIVIHAPAGYGKSSLVSRWLDQRGLADRTAWLALDEDDNDPRDFVRHLAAALEQMIPNALALVQPILHDVHAPVERAMQLLCTAVQERAGARHQPILLILDDLHFIETPAVHTLIASCLEHGPDALHLILMARRRTALPLARLVAHGKVAALEVDDLRFTEEEVAAYIQRRDFPLPSKAEVAELTARSEGWITALQLAALATRDHTAVHHLLDTMHGANTWLADFLTDEVLHQQPPALRSFLLQTSLLDAFNAELCAAVTGLDDSFGKLAAIARADLFLISLNGKGWFRYHHLFQEMLLHRLRAQMPAPIIAELHRRAANWLAGAGQIHSAVRHLLAAGAPDEAATLAEAELRASLLRDPYRAQSLLTLLPEDVLRRRPQLMLDRCRIAVLFDDRQVLSYLPEAECTLQLQAATDPHASRHHAEWLVLQAGGAFLRNDLATAANVLRTAQARLPLLDDFHAGAYQFLQMHLHRYAGRRTEMVQAAEAGLAAFERADWAAGVVALRRELARWSMTNGDSEDATRRFQAIAQGDNFGRVLVTNELIFANYFAAENCYWQDQLEQALAYQQACIALAVQLQDQELICLARSLGAVLSAPGLDIQELTYPLGQVKSRAVFEHALDCRTRCLIAVGQCDLAWQLVDELGREFERVAIDSVRRQLIVTYLRVHIARGVDLLAVTATLAEALTLARTGGERLIELHLQALTAWQQLQINGAEAARPALAEAVRLARETGYVRVLLDIPVQAELLEEMGDSLAPGAPTPNRAQKLTAQEQNVLKLLAADYTYEQIGAELVLSIGTVRTHVRHIYEKLGVHRRDQAVAVAQKRGFLVAG
jgi:LuxR family maltose regulon positive regulatory protein